MRTGTNGIQKGHQLTMFYYENLYIGIAAFRPAIQASIDTELNANN